MTSINMASILAKAQRHMQSNEGKRKISRRVDEIILGNISVKTTGGSKSHTPEEAARKFIEVLQQTILSDGTMGAIADDLCNLSFSPPVKTKDNTYMVEVFFNVDLSRPSLNPSKYGGIDNIAALFNNGYDTNGKIVWGMWHGSRIHSLPMRDGNNFIQTAINTFKSTYSSEYGVIEIIPNDIYA